MMNETDLEQRINNLSHTVANVIGEAAVIADDLKQIVQSSATEARNAAGRKRLFDTILQIHAIILSAASIVCNVYMIIGPEPKRHIGLFFACVACLFIFIFAITAIAVWLYCAIDTSNAARRKRILDATLQILMIVLSATSIVCSVFMITGPDTKQHSSFGLFFIYLVGSCTGIIALTSLTVLILRLMKFID